VSPVKYEYSSRSLIFLPRFRGLSPSILENAGAESEIWPLPYKS
jgi:hypothetical protein